MDRVRLKGCERPTRIYTYDAPLSAEYAPPRPAPPHPPRTHAHARTHAHFTCDLSVRSFRSGPLVRAESGQATKIHTNSLRENYSSNTHSAPRRRAAAAAASQASNEDSGPPPPELDAFLRGGAPPVTSAAYRRRWAAAVGLYLGGPAGEGADWPAARHAAEALAGAAPPAHEGPLRALLATMDAARAPDGRAPPGWRGYRKLDEK